MKSIPKHFVSLQKLGYKCINYYFGKGGQEIGLSKEFLHSIGITNDTLWAHPDILKRLRTAQQILNRAGYDFAIKDAFRPVALVEEICRLRKEQGKEVEKLISQEKMPHATGMAIDVTLYEFFEDENEFYIDEEVYTRDNKKDGDDCSYVGFYEGKTDADSINFQNIQKILIGAFHRAGFVLGNRREVWHFEMPNLSNAPRY